MAMKMTKGKASPGMEMRNTMTYRGDEMVSGNAGRADGMGMKAKGNKRSKQVADRYK